MIRNSKRIDLHKPFGPRVFQINLKCNIYFFFKSFKVCFYFETFAFA